MSRDGFTNYQKLLISILNSYKQDKYYVSTFILQAVYEYLLTICQSISTPLPTPFITLASWFNEIKLANQLALTTRGLSILLEVFQPTCLYEIINEMRYLPFLLSHKVEMVLYPILHKYSTQVNHTPLASVLLIQQSHHLILDILSTDWFLIPNEYHLIYLIRLIIHPTFKILPFKPSHLTLILSLHISSLYHVIEIIKFFQIYITVFPQSSLSQSLWVSVFFSDSLPQMNSSLYSNITFLSNLNFC
jgi:hypothetical protein